jgi:hypothetical protein
MPTREFTFYTVDKNWLVTLRSAGLGCRDSDDLASPTHSVLSR